MAHPSNPLWWSCIKLNESTNCSPTRNSRQIAFFVSSWERQIQHLDLDHMKHWPDYFAKIIGSTRLIQTSTSSMNCKPIRVLLRSYTHRNDLKCIKYDVRIRNIIRMEEHILKIYNKVTRHRAVRWFRKAYRMLGPRSFLMPL